MDAEYNSFATTIEKTMGKGRMGEPQLLAVKDYPTATYITLVIYIREEKAKAGDCFCLRQTSTHNHACYLLCL